MKIRKPIWNYMLKKEIWNNMKHHLDFYQRYTIPFHLCFSQDVLTSTLQPVGSAWCCPSSYRNRSWATTGCWFQGASQIYGWTQNICSRSYYVIKYHQISSNIIKYHQMPSNAIKCQQISANIIKYHHRIADLNMNPIGTHVSIAVWKDRATVSTPSFPT